MLNAKYKVEKMFLKQVFNYLQKNPEENLEKIMKWIRKFDIEHLYDAQYDVIEGYLAPVFARAEVVENRTYRLEGTLEEPQMIAENRAR